jgi:acetylglutamate kinase
MIPKVQACTQALDRGVSKTHIVDGRVAHCLLLEIFTKEGIGTEIVA